MTRRSRTEIFNEITDKIKKRKIVARAELAREILTDTRLYNKCIEALKETGMVKSSYVFTPTGRQREMLEATPNLENSGLIIKALSKVVSPSLRDLVDEYWGRKHQATDTRTKEELENEKKGHSTIDLLSELHSRGRAREYE